MFDRGAPSASQTAFNGYRVASARARDVFLAAREFPSLLQDIDLHHLLAEQALLFARLVLQGAEIRRRNDLIL